MENDKLNNGKNYAGILMNKAEETLDEAFKSYKDSNLQFLAVFGIFFALDITAGDTSLEKLYTWLTITSLFIAVIGETILARYKRGTYRSFVIKVNHGLFFLTLDIYNVMACLVVGILIRFFPIEFSEIIIIPLLIVILLPNLIIVSIIYFWEKAMNVYTHIDIELSAKILSEIDELAEKSPNNFIDHNMIMNLVENKTEKKKEMKHIITFLKRLNLIEEIGNNQSFICQLD